MAPSRCPARQVSYRCLALMVGRSGTHQAVRSSGPFLEPPPAPAPLTASEPARFEQERTAAETRDGAADRDREVPDALPDATSADDALTVPPIRTAP